MKKNKKNNPMKDYVPMATIWEQLDEAESVVLDKPTEVKKCNGHYTIDGIQVDRNTEFTVGEGTVVNRYVKYQLHKFHYERDDNGKLVKVEDDPKVIRTLIKDVNFVTMKEFEEIFKKWLDGEITDEDYVIWKADMVSRDVSDFVDYCVYWTGTVNTESFEEAGAKCPTLMKMWKESKDIKLRD